jgi:hypothetical protein
MKLLVETLDQIKEHLPINASFTFDGIRPFIESVQGRYIVPYIGVVFFNELYDRYKGNDSKTLSDLDNELLYKVRKAIAHLAYLEYIPHGNVMVSDMGIHISVNEQKKTAFQWQVEELKDSYRKHGFDAIDDFLLFLEDKREEADFALWKNGTGYTLKNQYFITSASEFSKYVNINGSRRVYMLLLPIMQRIESQFIQAITCTPMFNDMKSFLVDVLNNYPAEYENLNQFIKPAVAHMTIVRAISELAVKMDDNGLTVFNNQSSSSKTLNTKQPAMAEQLSILKQEHYDDAKSYLSQLEDYLTQNVAEYPLYQSSPCYRASGGVDINDDDTRGVYYI